MPGSTSPAARSNVLGQVASGGTIAAPVAAVFGFVADVLTPLGPINGVLFAVASVAFLLLAYRCHGQRRCGTLDMTRTIPERALVFTSFLLLGFGVWFALQFVAAADGRGVVAQHVASIATIQDAIVGVRKDVAEATRVAKTVQEDTATIRRDTAAIQANTAALRDSSADIARDTATVADATTTMAQGMERLTDRLARVGEGGLIDAPASPADFYHNAKLQELSGRFREAFASYKSYMDFNEEFVDPCLSYLDLLRSQHGHEAAEAEFGRLARQFPDNRAVRLAGLSSGAGAARRQALERFVAENPDFGPGHWLAAKEFSTEVMGAPSSIAVEHEKDHLEALQKQDEAGRFGRWFLDKRFAADQMRLARSRLNEIRTRQLGVRVSLREDGGPSREGCWFDLGIMGMNVAILDGYARSAYFKIEDEAWSEAPVRQVNERLSHVHWGDGQISSVWMEKLGSDPDAEAVVWIKYRDAEGMESQPQRLCRIRDGGPRGIFMSAESGRP